MTVKAHTEDKILIDGVEYLTRPWYMHASRLDATRDEQSQRHRDYYRQFVTPSIERMVRQHFNREWPAMVTAYLGGDKYLNSCTELKRWDQLNDMTRSAVGRKLTLCAYADPTPGQVFWSLSENTCICKEAARMLIERSVEG